MFQPAARAAAHLGVDICTSSVAMLQINHEEDKPYLSAYGMVQLGRPILSGNKLLDPAALIPGIKQLQQNFTTNQVVIALPDAAVMSKTLSLKADLCEDELAAVVSLEIGNSIPCPVSELVYDFAVKENQDSEWMEVLVVAARRALLQERLDLLARAELIPIAVEIESLAVARLCMQRFKEECPVLLLDIDAYGLRFFVVDIKGFRFAHYEPLLHGKSDLVVQIKRILQLCYSSGLRQNLQKILLCGDISGQPELVFLLQKSLRIPVSLANPFLGMKLHSRLDKAALNATAQSFALACGLGLRCAC